MVKLTPPEGQFLTKNFDFRGQISTIQAENTPKSWSLKVKKMSKQLLNISKTIFLTVQKTTFLAPKMVKSRVPILVKVSFFECILDLKPQILPQKCSNRF